MGEKLDMEALLAKNPKAAAIYRKNKQKLKDLPKASRREYGLALPYGASRLMPSEDKEGSQADATLGYVDR